MKYQTLYMEKKNVKVPRHYSIIRWVIGSNENFFGFFTFFTFFAGNTSKNLIFLRLFHSNSQNSQKKSLISVKISLFPNIWCKRIFAVAFFHDGGWRKKLSWAFHSHGMNTAIERVLCMCGTAFSYFVVVLPRMRILCTMIHVPVLIITR